MAKKIAIIMNQDETISIKVDDKLKHTIDDDHKISATAIYDILNFSIGDEFEVSTENEFEIKPEVLSFFAKLIDDIITQVNSTFDSHKVDILPENHIHESVLIEED
ncbi:MAG: hypothetical protein PHI32_09295 [Dysgonamonadaceae bacterium]|nr:hypothetical protein [Dysgonamonadaceae bacterium]